MNVTVELVPSFDLRNLLGYDAPEAQIKEHEACITDSTQIWLGRADGVDACAIGVIPYGSIFSETVYIWLIYTRICEQHPLRFIRWSRRVIDEIRYNYPVIVGLCKCDGEHSQAWLKCLGASFDYHNPYNGHYRFRIE